MSERSVNHASFTLERSYDQSPARVYAAFADRQEKTSWFGDPSLGTTEYALDFRVGGRERSVGEMEGATYTFDAVYQDIVENERIVYTYAMLQNDTRISVSLSTLEFHPAGDGTRLVYTEHGAFLDGLDTPEAREGGSGQLFDMLEQHLAKAAASA